MKTFLFLGDSITEAGRFDPPASWLSRQPAGDSFPGYGYVSVLKEQYAGARFVNRGFDGFTVPALLRMLSRDGLACSPDFVSLLIGINDVGVAMHTMQSLRQLDFAGSYRRLLEAIRSACSAPVLCIGPFLFAHPQKYSAWMPVRAEAEAIERSEAERLQIPFLSVQERFTQEAGLQGFDAVTTDGIHLTPEGHALLAKLIRPCMETLIHTALP